LKQQDILTWELLSSYNRHHRTTFQCTDGYKKKLWKESIHSKDQQLYQYKPNEQQSRSSNNLTT